MAQKKLVTHPPTKTSNADVDIGTLGNIGSPLKSESPKNLQYLKEKSEKLKSSIQKENAQRFTKKSGKIISGQECGQGFNEKCLGMIAELRSSDDVKKQRKIVRECSPQSVTHHLMVKSRVGGGGTPL